MNAGPEPLLLAESLDVGWRGRPVLRGVSFALRPGETLGIVGPNGSGKSTLLRTALGLSRPLGGRVVRSAAWRAGHVPQRDALGPLLRFCALHVVEMFARVAAPSAAAAQEASREALRAVGMADAAHRDFQDLSGGQRQRVLLARALAVRPTVLVLDEPTSGMDVRAEAEMLALVRRIRRERGLAVLLVTHSLHVVADEATTALLLHDGRADFGAPEEVLSSEHLERVYGCPVTSVVVGGHRVVRAEPQP